MTDKKTEELNEQELDQVQGGASIGDLKPGLTKAGKRAIKGAGIRVGKGAGIRKVGAGIRASNVINGGASKGEI